MVVVVGAAKEVLEQEEGFDEDDELDWFSDGEDDEGFHEDGYVYLDDEEEEEPGPYIITPRSWLNAMPGRIAMVHTA